MTAEAFAAAVERMSALPPVMSNRLLELNPLLTGEQRLETLQRLTPLHADIVGAHADLLRDVEEGEKEMDALERTFTIEERKFREEQDRARDAASSGDPSALAA